MPKVYVGNLDDRTEERDLDDAFYKYGRIRDIFLRRPMRGAPFAFIEFDDDRDADDAVHYMDGVRLDGARIRVERARQRDRDRGRDSRGPPRRRSSEFRVRVTGLPEDMSWQDLKDFLRTAGVSDIPYANVSNGVGTAELNNRDDLDAVIDKLDDTEAKSRFGARARVRIEKDTDGGNGGGRDRSPSPRGRRRRSRSRSRSRSGSRGGARSRSRSRSRSGSAGRKPSRSRSRSGSAGAERKPSRSRSRSRSRSASAGRADGDEAK